MVHVCVVVCVVLVNAVQCIQFVFVCLRSEVCTVFPGLLHRSVYTVCSNVRVCKWPAFIQVVYICVLLVAVCASAGHDLQGRGEMGGAGGRSDTC